MLVTKVVCPANKIAIKCPYTMTPEYITVHNTANDASAMSEISYMLGNNYETSFHFAVDDYRAVQGLELNRNGWHAGDGNGKGNRKSIGIEICYSKSGGERFVKAEKNAAILVAELLKQYGWGIDRVKKHQDWSGKYCPHRTLDLGWARFLDMVKAELKESLPAVRDTNVDIFYRVRTVKHGWLGEVKNFNDNDPVNGYAGWENSPITDVAIRVSKGSVKYRVHVKGGGWLGWITKCDLKDPMYGYAGNGKPIDAIEIYYYTPDDIRPYKKAKYKVNNYGWQFDTETTNGQDGYAGVMGVVVTKLRATID